MRSMLRNKSSYKYLTYKGKSEISKGLYKTGEYKITYYAPIERKDVIGVAQGQDLMETYGVAQDYDKIIVIDDPNLGIDENTLFFIDKQPIYNNTTFTISNSDYIVSKIAKSLNVLRVYVKKVRPNES